MTSKGARFTDKKQLKALLLSTKELVSTTNEESILINIFDTKYEVANLDELTSQSKNRSHDQQKKSVLTR